jgi:hypothetical protein
MSLLGHKCNIPKAIVCQPSNNSTHNSKQCFVNRGPWLYGDRKVRNRYSWHMFGPPCRIPIDRLVGCPRAGLKFWGTMAKVYLLHPPHTRRTPEVH